MVVAPMEWCGGAVVPSFAVCGRYPFLGQGSRSLGQNATRRTGPASGSDFVLWSPFFVHGLEAVEHAV